MKVPLLDAERALLRPLALSDAPALHAAYGDPDVCLYWSRPAHERLEQTERDVEWEIANGHSWAIVDAERGRESDAVGRVSLFPGKAPGVLEVGILLSRAAWGRGLARGALKVLVPYGFTELDAHRIFADADPENRACIRLFESVGFEREGLLRQAWRTHLGLRDSVILARLRDR